MAGSRTRVTLLLLFIFAAGAAAGVAADRLSLVPGTARAEETKTPSEERKDRGRRETTIERFADELGLTGPQRARIEAILEGFRDDVKELRKEFHPRWHALLDTARTRIEAVLTPEQVTQYRALLEQERKKRRRGKDDDRGSGADDTESGEPDDRESEADEGGSR